MTRTEVPVVGWYAISTKPRQEQQAMANLDLLGLETFWPRIRQRKKVRRRVQVVTGPLFPGYLFARFDIYLRGRAVGYARGVRRIVAFGVEPARVDENIIESIRSRLTNGCLEPQGPTWEPGQSVRIQSGPLEGLEAVFEREMSGHDRVVLLLQAIRAQWRVVLPADQVANF